MAGRSATPWEREAVAIRLFERAAAGESVELAELSGMERCVLAGPGPVLWEQQPVARAWDEFGDERRAEATKLAVAGLRERRLLLEDVSQGSGGSAWSVSPELGIIQAARRKPAYIVAAEVEGRKTRSLRFFAVGDNDQAVRGVVVEEPAAPGSTGSTCHLRNPGPLGWMTHYRLVSEGAAVGILTDLALVPRQDSGGTYPYGIRRFQRPGGGAITEAGISVVGAGSMARVRGFRGADEFVAMKADALRDLLGRLLTTGSW
jgi:hypothetical protein